MYNSNASVRSPQKGSRKPVKPTKKAVSVKPTAYSTNLLPRHDTLAYNHQPDDLAFLDAQDHDSLQSEQELRLSQLDHARERLKDEDRVTAQGARLKESDVTAASVTDFGLKFYDQLKVYESHGLCSSWKDRVLMAAAFLRYKLTTCRNVLDL